MPFFIRHKDLKPVKPTPNPYSSRLPWWRQHMGLWPLLCLLLLGGSFQFSPHFHAFAEQVFFEKVSWLEGVVARPFHAVASLFAEATAFRQDMVSLRSENEALKWKTQALSRLHAENAALRRALHVPDITPYRSIVVPVLATPYDGLHHLFLVGKGSAQGLIKNQAVIVPEGVVGRLEKVGQEVAHVLLLNDRRSRLPVMTVSSEQKAILAGEGDGFPVLVYVSNTRNVKRGEQVVTSGLGGMFPVGLPVGIVEDVVNGKIRVRPYAPFQKLDWVHVLQLPATGEIGRALEECQG